MRWFKKDPDQVVQKSKDELHNYWRRPDQMNDPSTYLESGERSAYLVSLVKKHHIRTDAQFLELGCNVGRNLHYLWKAGYRNLSGVEINPDDIRLMKENFPDMQATTYQGTIEDLMEERGEHELIITMAVLEHLHHDSEWVFS